MGKLTDYATVIMSFLAQNSASVHAASELAVAVGISGPTALKVLKTLARAGLLQSQRGTKGGYQLARPAEHISMADILQAMEGPIGLTQCGSRPGTCERESKCAVRTNWQRISQAVGEALARVSLAEMALPAPHTVHFLRADGATRVNADSAPQPEWQPERVKLRHPQSLSAGLAGQPTQRNEIGEA